MPASRINVASAAGEPLNDTSKPTMLTSLIAMISLGLVKRPLRLGAICATADAAKEF